MQYHAIGVLNLPVCAQVGDHGPVRTVVIVVIEIQDFFLL
jgi:hypothetical protein